MWWNILTFTIAYVVFHLTAFPSVPGGDSGELLAEACVRNQILSSNNNDEYDY